MMVGLTYDLREEYLKEGYGEEETAEFDRPDTISAIEVALQTMGYGTDRIGGVRSLVRRLAAGERWELVFNIAEGLTGYAREAQVPSLLEIYGIPYTFSDPLVLSLTLHKGMTKHVVRGLGLPTPEFRVVENEADLEGLALPFPLFAKPVAEGTGKGITPSSKIHSGAELRRECRRLWERFKQPALVERFLPGKEFTVGIIGTGREAEALGCMEVILKDEAERDVYSYTNKEESEERVEYQLAKDPTAEKAMAIALAVWRGLDCRDAGRVDLRCDEGGNPMFMEINPLAGLHPQHSDLPILCTLLGISYQQLIERILFFALKRVK